MHGLNGSRAGKFGDDNVAEKAFERFGGIEA